MLANDNPKNRRLSVMVSETFVARVTQIAEAKQMSMSAFVRHAVEREYERSLDETLAAAAEQAAPLYEQDEELTAFTSIDADDFA